MTASPMLTRYLERHAEPECAALDGIGGNWKSAASIPACSESEDFEQVLQTLAAADGASDHLALVVVNGSETSPKRHHERNRAFLEWIRKKTGAADTFMGLGSYGDLDVLVVDRASPDRLFPPRQGVGLARKISIDIPTALFAKGQLESPWVRSTDADVWVPGDYWTRTPPTGNAAAAWMPYAHVLEGDQGQQTSMLEYEIYLHYHALGLQSSGSPYPFPCIGSTLWLHVEKYAAVRGFPKKEAGEDFYLLNKLAKVGEVVPLPGERLKIRGRVSDRVPFGTGAALTKMALQKNEGAGYQLYDPRVYRILSEFLEVWSQVGATGEVLVLTEWLTRNQETIPAFTQAFDEAGVSEAAAAAVKHAKPGPGLTRRLDEWMDGFRTMRLMHRIRDNGYPNLSWREAVERAPFCPSKGSESLEEICSRLREEVERVVGCSSVGRPRRRM